MIQPGILAGLFVHLHRERTMRIGDLSLGTVSNSANYRSRTFMLLVGIGR